MKKLLFVACCLPLCVTGAERPSQSSLSSLPVRKLREVAEVPKVHTYNSSIRIHEENDQVTVVNLQLEAKVYEEHKKIEIVLRVWEIDRLIATRKLTLNW